MRRHVLIAAAVLSVFPVSLKAGIAVEEIEAYEDTGGSPTHYAPVDFAGASSITLQAGQLGGLFPGITFHATGGTTSSMSNHAYAVGASFYGNNSVAFPFVTDVYAAPNTNFLTTTTNAQSATGIAPAPGNFSNGAVVVNNSYVYSTGATPSDLDLLRRLDFMINRSDVTFVSSAVSDVGGLLYNIPWTSFNALSVTGDQQTFSVAASPGKQHADLSLSGQASFTSAAVSSYAAALYGTAKNAGQTDAQHGVTIRSLLMAGADKTNYVRQTANNLDITTGAGEADYTSSLSILKAGEKPLLAVNGSTVAGTPSVAQRGWTEGTVAAGGKSVVLFHSDGFITGLTASLNWDVTQSTPSAGQIDTRTAASQFANLGLEVRPVTLSNGSYTLSASLADSTLHSTATGDNVQYLYSTNTLAAGDYAFLISDNSAFSPAVGFSYAFTGLFPNAWKVASSGSWGSSSNWADGIPNLVAAQASFPVISGGVASASVTLDGNRIVGKLLFSGATSYTVSQGSAGVLTINDTGDASGTALVAVSSGSHSITAPVVVTDGVTASVAGASSLEISNGITGAGGLTKTGTGTLTLDGSESFGNASVTAGTVVLTPGASFPTASITVGSGAVLKLTAPGSAGVLVRTLSSSLALSSGAIATVDTPLAPANRQLIVEGNITFAGSLNNWAGQFELSSNDLDLTGASLASITNQIKQGLYSGTSQGITSAAASSGAAHLQTLGVLVNNNGAGTALYGNGTTLGLFDSRSPASGDVLVKYTFFGDANLDGSVSVADFARIDTGFTGHLSGWYNGDFNYDGTIDGSDYTLIDNAFNTTGSASIAAPTSLLASSSAAVPEPAGAALFFAGLVTWATGRSRRTRRTAQRTSTTTGS